MAKLPVKNHAALGLMAAASVAFSAGSALAQDRATERRLGRLEAELRDLQGQVYGQEGARGGAPVRYDGADPDPAARSASLSASDRTADLSLRIGALEREMQRLTGRMEELTFSLRQQDERMNRLVELTYPEAEERMSLGLESQRAVLGSAARATQGPLPAADGPVDLVGGGELETALPSFSSAEAAYNAGRQALLSGQYNQAERAFLALTGEFPDSQQAADGLYYLGETYLARGDLGAAARTLLDFIRQNNDNPRAPEAHLKLGQAFVRAGKAPQACRVWDRAVQTYSEMGEALRGRLEELRAENCQA